MLIAPLAPEHAQDAARLHILGQPGTFLTALGPDVLAVLYRALPQTPGGFGYAALDGSVLIGYVSATTSIGGLFATMATQRLPELLPPLLRRYARDPRLALRSVQTALYPLLVREPEPDPGGTAELLSIMVEPARRSHGTGALLVEALLQASRNRSLAALTVTVDAANTGAQRFYARHRFLPDHPIRLNGRDMLVLRRTL